MKFWITFILVVPYCILEQADMDFLLHACMHDVCVGGNNSQFQPVMNRRSSSQLQPQNQTLQGEYSRAIPIIQS